MPACQELCLIFTLLINQGFHPLPIWVNLGGMGTSSLDIWGNVECWITQHFVFQKDRVVPMDAGKFPGAVFLIMQVIKSSVLQSPHIYIPQLL